MFPFCVTCAFILMLTQGHCTQAQMCMVACDIPTAAEWRAGIEEAYRLALPVRDGQPLAMTADAPVVDVDAFGICVVTVGGEVYTVGDTGMNFAIQSICKPVMYGLALQQHGRDYLLERVGIEATGFPFNSIAALSVRPTKLQNPNVNAGAMAVASLLKGSSAAERWQSVLEEFKHYIGREPTLSQGVLKSEMAGSATNQVLAQTMLKEGLLYSDAQEAVELYLKGCSLEVTAKDLAEIAAVWATAGKHPISQEQVFPAKFIRDILSAITINGVYDSSGAWLFNIGIPTKSGVGGGICACVPGICGIGIFSPRLDQAGNSVRGQLALQHLSKRFRLHIFDPRPPRHDWIPEEEYRRLQSTQELAN